MVVTARAWAGGPLRRYLVKGQPRCEGRPDRYDAEHSPYLCDDCAASGGVYEFSGLWLCGECKEARETFGR